MGSGASRKKVRKVDRAVQMPPVTELKPSGSQPKAKGQDPLFTRATTIPPKRPASNHGQVFTLEPNLEDYSTIWDIDTKLSKAFQQSLKSPLNTKEHYQIETLDNNSNRKSTTDFKNTHVESIVDNQTHSSINLSSSEKIDELINNLNSIHTQLDDIIRRRTEQISMETESVLLHIRHETQEKQQRLLNYAKDEQLKHDENYKTLLEEYLKELDQLKAKQLSDLQDQLQDHRQQIFEESQLKILNLNQQANLIKAKILREEQQQAAQKIDLLVAQIQKIAEEEKLQHLGSETITKTNIITNAHFGTKILHQAPPLNDHKNESSASASRQIPPVEKTQGKTRGRQSIQEEQSFTNSAKNGSVMHKYKKQE